MRDYQLIEYEFDEVRLSLQLALKIHGVSNKLMRFVCTNIEKRLKSDEAKAVCKKIRTALYPLGTFNQFLTQFIKVETKMNNFKSKPCDCHDMIYEKAYAEAKKRLTQTFGELTEVGDGKFDNVTISKCDGRETKIFTPKIMVKYRKVKKDGTPYEKQNTFECDVYPSFCSFCGKKLNYDK